MSMFLYWITLKSQPMLGYCINFAEQFQLILLKNNL